MQIEVFSTCPQSKDLPREDYLERVIQVSRWSEGFGLKGILVYSDNGLVDPWLVAQAILLHTRELAPLVAVQPLYMHPYTAAKMVASLGHLHGRRLFLNMIAGGFKNDLESLNDPTPHDERYARMVEYTLLLKRLLRGTGPVTFEGRYYTVRDLRMKPPLPPELFPGLISSGSSPAGWEAARAVGAVAVKYPRTAGQEVEAGADGGPSGIRVGIVARADEEEAWRTARARFPEDGLGQVTHRLAMKVSDSHWHRQLSALEQGGEEGGGVYWLGPFRNYQTFCPYLVGSYRQVGLELARYIALGYRTFILDVPPSEEELAHTRQAFEDALQGAAR